MSRADTSERIVAAATALGVQRGVGGLSLQAIASAAGVSKALVLYHFGGKAGVLAALAEGVGTANVSRLERARLQEDPMSAWRALVHDEVIRGDLALLSALSLEAELPAATLAQARAAREVAAARLATAILAALELTPRVPAAFLGRLLLRELDGIAVAAARGGFPHEAVDAELDAVALALLSLGR